MVSRNRSRGRKKKPMIFSAWNYKILAVGLLLVIVGFSAMYIENEVKGFISLYLSPVIIMTGYVSVIVAILKHDRDSSAVPDES
ncbi:hypothetical protein SAMN05443144_101276 [Fodinibius roseus]|uniref:DUF3098 domain-containing protein n=1 Tax=Fodinibius roseus TaxID=1194090 RepID=A0A1M4TEH4_9BACT|nr:hypothetical protein [Fodinibius roseus]SHE42890.1 hypothetical protein SAMN05443144_101276 [Fodinibius roseus]